MQPLGGEKRIQATFKFFIYTFAGSLVNAHRNYLCVSSNFSAYGSF